MDHSTTSLASGVKQPGQINARGGSTSSTYNEYRENSQIKSLKNEPTTTTFASSPLLVPESHQATEGTGSPESHWSATVWRTGPLFGISCILFVILSIPAAATVLAVSNNQAVDTWSVDPSVYLAIFTGIGNRAIAFAAAQGALITWWMRATKGTTWFMLHHDWLMGSSPLAAFLAVHRIPVRRIGILAVTSLCALVIIMDGVLLQSSSTVVQKSLNQSVELNVRISPEIPTNFTGRYQVSPGSDGGNVTAGAIFSNFLPVQTAYFNNETIPFPGTGCPGVCQATLKAAALSADFSACETVASVPLDISQSRQTGTVSETCRQVLNLTDPTTTFDNVTCPIFLVSVETEMVPGSQEAISLLIGAVDQGMAMTCSGTFTLKRCLLKPAIGEYSVTIANDTVQLLGMGLGSLGGLVGAIDSLANNTVVPDYTEALINQNDVNSTLTGIAATADTRFHSAMTWQLRDGTDGFSDINEITTRVISNWPAMIDRSGDCMFEFRDPTYDIYSGLGELMFRTSVFAAQSLPESELLSRIDPGLQVTSKVEGIRVDPQAVFKTRWRYFWAASAVQLVCSLLILYTYRDYWTLGREVSFSPLELAKAFDAPSLRDQPSNSEAGAMAKAMGDQEVRYGAVQPDGKVESKNASRRLIFDYPDRVYKPMNTFAFLP